MPSLPSLVFFIYCKITFVLGFWSISGGLIHGFVGFDGGQLGVVDWWLGWLWVSMVVGCGFWLMGFDIDFDSNGF